MRDIDVQYLSPRSDVVTEEDIAQGHEFALHLLSIGLEAYVINADLTRPNFKNLFNPDHKWLVDQPDAIYLTATISTGYSYVIRGKQEGQVYFSYTVYTHKTGGGWAENILSETAFPTSSVSGLSLMPNENGDYTVYVSSTRPKKMLESNEQWLRIPEESGPAEVSVLARHYFEGPVSIQMYEGRQRSDVVATIDVVDEEEGGKERRSKFPPIPTDENVAQRIDFLSNFLIDHTIKMGPGGDANKRPGHRIPEWYSIVNNVIGKPGRFVGSSTGAGAPDVHYAAGPWKLESHQALIIEGRFPSKDKCIFANVLLLNKFMQSLDYQHGRSQHYNRNQLKDYGNDGSYKMILSHENPGDQYNWLDTEGRATGIVFYRYFLNTAVLEQVTTRVVNFNDL
jgi:hypothetical protein